MLWTLAFKNIWRNKLRTIVVIIAIVLGVFAGIFITAFMNGMIENRLNAVILTETSDIQMMKPGFQDNYNFADVIENSDAIISKIKQIKNIEFVSKRIVISSIVASAETSSGCMITGVIPSREKKVTNISDKIIEGNYFTNDKKNQVIIGKKLANKLRVEIKNKIIITVQDVNNNITSGAFRVSGIYETDNSIFDEANVFVNYLDICRLTGLKGTEAHTIAIRLYDNNEVNSVKRELQKLYPSLEVRDWMELSPEAGYLVSAMNQYLYIFILIILIALCFSIINTMLMVVLERIREIGMLMAIGMSRIRIFIMIMLETVYLSLSGGIIGIVTGYFICRQLAKSGLDLFFWKEAFSSVGYSSVIYPVINFQMIMIITIMVILAGIFSSVYPAYKALKYKPAEATRI